jgi:hypothetical protein
MSDKKIQEAWKEYERLAVPEHATERQRRDLRMTFFSGAAFTFASMIIAMKNSTNEEAETILLAFDRELYDWGKEKPPGGDT